MSRWKFGAGSNAAGVFACGVTFIWRPLVVMLHVGFWTLTAARREKEVCDE